jgi:hypothetical protein
VTIDSALQNIAHLFLDTAPVIFRLQPLSWLPRKVSRLMMLTRRRVTEIDIIVLDHVSP